MPHQLRAFTGIRRWVSPPSEAPGLPQRVQVGAIVGVAAPRRTPFLAGFRARLFSFCVNQVNAKPLKRRHSSAMLRRSRSDMREDETPEPEDLPDLEAERAFANAVIVDGLTRDPERAREVHRTRHPLVRGERPLFSGRGQRGRRPASGRVGSVRPPASLTISVRRSEERPTASGPWAAGDRPPRHPSGWVQADARSSCAGPGQRSNGRNRQIDENAYQAMTYATQGPRHQHRQTDENPFRSRRTRPCRTISPSTNCAVLLATAKQMPCAPWMIAVLMPMTSPLEDSSGPPELPGLSAVSVWITSSIRVPVL